MTEREIMALLPYFVLSGGIGLLLLVIAFMRSHVIAMGFTVLTLIATLAVMPMAFAAAATPVVIDGLVTVDRYALFFFVLFILAAVVTILLAYQYLNVRVDYREEFYILLGTAVLGAASTAAASHFVAFLLGLEVLSISLYAMIAYPEHDRPPLEAAAKYLVLSGAASSTMLFGMALIYAATRSLAFTSPMDLIGQDDHVLVAIGQTMLLAGIFFKLSLVPFHAWTPDVYQGSPAPVAGFIATVSKGAVFAALLRYTVDAQLLATVGIPYLILIVGVLSMIVGNILALLQTNLKRLLAYSSIAHLGYLLIALVVAARLGGASLGIEASLVYLTGYFAMTLAAFGVMTVLSKDQFEAEELAAYGGLFWQHPILAAVLTAAALSLAGIPLTVGFIAKFYLIAAGAETAQWIMLWALLIGSAIGIYYYLRIVLAMIRRPRTTPPRPTVSPMGWVAVISLGLAILVMGIAPSPLVDFVRALGGP